MQDCYQVLEQQFGMERYLLKIFAGRTVTYQQTGPDRLQCRKVSIQLLSCKRTETLDKPIVGTYGTVQYLLYAQRLYSSSL